MTSETLTLALDYGVKKTGMALGNSITCDARPFDILAMNNGQPDWENLLGIIEHWGIDKVLVGLPLNMDGSESMLTKRAHKFARRLAHRLGERRQAVSVFIYDERLSSKEAKMIALDNGWIASSSEPIDDIAACLLLDSYYHAPNHAIYVSERKDSHKD